MNFRILSERIGRGMSGKFNIQNVDLQFILVKAEFVNGNLQISFRKLDIYAIYIAYDLILDVIYDGKNDF